jgi:hypothetical protein
MEEKRISSDDFWEGVTDKSGNPIIAYKTSGEKGTKAEFQQAINAYYEGKPIAGFSVVNKGSLAHGLRSATAAIPQVMGGEDVSMYNAANKLRTLVGKAPIPQDVIEKEARSGSPIGSPFTFLGNQLNTPEKLLSAIAMGGAAKATSGISGVLSTLARGGAAGAGELVGGLLGQGYQASNSEMITKPLLTAAASAGVDGAIGVIKTAAGMGLNRKLEDAMGNQLVDLLKSKYPHLSRQGVNGVKAIASTPEGVSDIAQAGMKAIMKNSDEIGESFVQRLNSFTPSAISNTDKQAIKTLIKNHRDSVRDLLDHLDDPGNYQDAVDTAVNNLGAKLTSVVSSKGGVTSATGAKLQALVADYYNETQSVYSGAQVINAFRESGAAVGFNQEEFQKYIIRKIQSDPSYLNRGQGIMEQVSDIAFRGGKRIPDKNLNFLANMPHRYTSRWMAPLRAIPMGTYYTGKTPTDLASTIVSVPIINQYQRRE